MGSLVAVLLGGIVGTGIRLELDALIYHDDTQFPLDTLLINIVGSFVLAILVSRLWPIAPAWVRAGLGPGLLGGFTTFSAVMVSMVTLAASSQILLALVYLLLTLVLGFGAAALGFRIARPRRRGGAGAGAGAVDAAGAGAGAGAGAPDGAPGIAGDDSVPPIEVDE